jgi:trans-aconitate methyltransferase
MNWYDVINKKNFVWNENTASVVSLLSPAAGLESSYKLHSSIFKIDKQAYHDFMQFLEIHLNNVESLFEYGCGNGALLYYFKHCHNMGVGGSDISEFLIDHCNTILGNTFTNNATTVDSSSYDFCISNSVFQYFPNYEYAETVIKQMSRIAKKGILITDIKDIETKHNFLSLQAERQNLTINELNEKYKTTPLLFYSRDFFKEFDIIDMPATYPDSDLKSYCARLIL